MTHNDMNAHSVDAENDERIFTEVSKVGLMVYSMMSADEEEESIVIRARGKVWRVIVEELVEPCSCHGGSSNGTGKQKKMFRLVFPFILCTVPVFL